MSLSVAARVSRALLRTLMKPRDLPVAQMRAEAQRSARFLHRDRDGIALEPWSAGAVPGWKATPTGPLRAPWVHLHGGGYVSGGLSSHQTFVQVLAATLGRPVVLPEYRLAPEHPFPAALDDALAVAAAQQGPWFLSGDSAGGGLAVALVQSLRNRGLPLPAGLVLWSPWVDLTLSGASMRSQARSEVLLTPARLDAWASAYAGGRGREHPGLSPLFGNLAHLPPLLVQVGSHEILLDDARRLVDGVHRAGGRATLSIWKGLWHVWPVLGDALPETAQALDEVLDFLKGEVPVSE